MIVTPIFSSGRKNLYNDNIDIKKLERTYLETCQNEIVTVEERNERGKLKDGKLLVGKGSLTNQEINQSKNYFDLEQ